MKSGSDTIKERQASYGKSWLVSGSVAEFVRVQDSKLVSMGLLYAWMAILNKLIRALRSPENPDHWRDIAGYATLAQQYVEDMNGNDDQTTQ